MKISIIIPCFNNEASIPELMQRLGLVMNHEVFTEHSFEFVLIDDGSKDNTYQVLENEAENIEKATVCLIKLTRNFGSYNAFLAGMHHASGDCNVYLHADLQDPPELVPELFQHYLKGWKLVIANRSSREDKSIFSEIYHMLVQKIAISKTPKGGFDLMLFDKDVRTEVIKISEKNTNQVYLINWLGYPFVSVPYKRVNRKYGKSQWAFWKKVQLFIDTFFSFSNLPVQLIRWSFYLSVLWLIVLCLVHLAVQSIPYFKLILIGSVAFSILNFNASIIVEFLARIHESVRNRPSFVVDTKKEIEKK